MKSKTIILFLLAVLFICPGLAAGFFYTHPSWLHSSTVNKGQMLAKPELLALHSPKKWGLILWNPGACDRTCRQELERLAKIRLALGRRLYQVEEVLVLGQDSNALTQQWTKGLQENDIALKLLPDSVRFKHKLLFDAPKIFIGDPEGYLILSYEIDAKSADIFHDIGLLLNVGKKNV